MIKKKTNLTAAIIIFIGGLLTAFGVFLAAKQAIKDSKELDEKNKKIIELTQENANLAKQSLDQITGGTSWAYIKSGLETIDGIPSTPSIWGIIVVGEIPLYDVSITISKITHNTPINNVTSYTLEPFFQKDLGTVTPSLSPESIGIIKLSGTNKIEYLVKIKARNGEIVQHIVLVKKQDNYWTTSQKVYRRKLSKGVSRRELLNESTRKDFPKQNIEWIDI